MIRPLLAALLLAAAPVSAQQSHLTVQSTTSTQNSGLYEHILPIFEASSGIDVRVVAVGTGQALKNAGNCDGDMLITHAKAAEETFVAEGKGLARHPLMYNDFVLVGPKADPAGAAGEDIVVALTRIAEAQAAFASRADDSGTNKAERALWAAAGTDPTQGSGAWYLETGSGMGATLNLGTAQGAYVLTDRATWDTFANKGDFEILVEGDPRLFNQYGIIIVNPAACPATRIDEAQSFARWLLGPEGQNAIEAFAPNGKQLFFPNASE
ncbi:sulfate transporter [Oceanicola sp. D3]|uniref:substrate-binding domain-containing protein n=1 Tax=Oceanicola sp. D3 TaxID=2587163 RepID=UPI00111DAF8B|nr:substrate-binding domain-containing protein [Oceanicola sp. D3]QDC11577.1 sulfate transporter [Oceanicola sp. D3]